MMARTVPFLGVGASSHFVESLEASPLFEEAVDAIKFSRTKKSDGNHRPANGNMETTLFWPGSFPYMISSKTFPTYPWNIPQTQNQLFMKEFLSFGEAWGMLQGYVGLLLDICFNECHCYDSTNS